ncbi:MAG: ArgE/DapE family deacylase [Candidatus Lokiarchaeota archaeon]|nr:ArgE/DapE family deacylase [Candidatus Lokiarchaeota archaeon]
MIFLSEDLIIEEIEKNKDEIIEFCQKIIKTDSINPPGNEANVAKIIKMLLEENNIECQYIDMGNNRANLIATLKGKESGKKKLLFNGHMDVVPIEKEELWKYPPLSATIKRKRIYGRGSADMKGPLTAMIMAMITLKRLNYPLKGALILNCVSDEEVGGALGTKYCVENFPEIRPDAIIVGEPSGMDPLPKAILIGEKGRIEVEITTHGRSCHASMPSLGTNSIEMFRKIYSNFPKLKNYIDVDPPFSEDELISMLSETFPSKEILNRIIKEQPLLQGLLDALSSFTYSCTIIKSGIKENVVPGECKALFDFRLLPGQKVEDTVRGVEKLIQDLGYEVKDSKDASDDEIYVSIKLKDQSEPSLIDNLNYEIIDILKKSYNDIYGKKSYLMLMPATTDARFFRNIGFCPQTIVFGPGAATLAHAVNEYIEIKDLINATKTYAITAARFLI